MVAPSMSDGAGLAVVETALLVGAGKLQAVAGGEGMLAALGLEVVVLAQFAAAFRTWRMSRLSWSTSSLV